MKDIVFDEAPLFKKAIVAAAFSPRLTAVLNEAHRILQLLGAWPIIVHVGDESPAKRVRLEEAIDRSSFSDHPPLCIVRHGAAADVLIEIAKEQNADLIVAGALAREALFKYYLGSVARSIARHAPCSVLLFTEPHEEPSTIQKIHCAVEYRSGSEKAVYVAACLASYLGTRDLYYTHSFIGEELDNKKTGNRAEFIRQFYQNEEKKLQDFIKKAGVKDMRYHTRCLHDQVRTTTLNFTRELEADLFIIHGPTDRFSLWNRMFGQNLEIALQHLPCSLLLTR
ncbi:universal stress protein [candidate division KSB1 bacterium]|nr:universal stress protein [candidate division KSB1 bacterium]